MSLLLQGAGGAGAWVPLDFPTLSVSYASAVVGRWEAHLGLGLADGAAISTWADQASSPHDYAGVSSARPTYQAGGWDGVRPCVRFDGVDDVLSTTSFGLTPPYYRFVVCRWNAAFSADTKVFDGRGVYNLLGRDTATTVIVYAGASNVVSTTPQAKHLYEARFNLLSTDLIIDGGAAQNVLGVPAINANGLVLGATHVPDGFANVDVCADIATNNISAPDQALIVAYLQAQWAV